jgi:DNA-binding PucR family transcriptional regulator
MADEHLLELIVHRDPKRAQALVERALEPLQKLSPGARERLTETLEAWLEHACSTTEAAQALHVHPQTLRYRLRQLEETIGGERLWSADARLELALALRVRRAQDVVPAVPRSGLRVL